jgi:nitrous oxidase accessory protein NosD
VDSLDFDNDGVVDIQTTVDRTFDNHGHLLSQVTEFMGGGTTTLTQEFDGHGNLLSSVEAADVDGDGIADSITSLTQEFSAQGKLVNSVQAFDLDGDGVADNVITHTFA